MTNDEAKDLINEALKSIPKGITKEEVDAIVAKTIEGIKPEVTKQELAELKSAMEEQGRLLAEKATKPEERKTIRDLLIANKVNELLKNKKTIDFQVKTEADAGDVTTANTVVASPTPKLSLLGAEGDVYAINRSIQQTILEYVDMGTTDRSSISWVDEVEGEGDAGLTTEGSYKNKLDIDYQEKVANSEKYTGLVKVTEEALDDISYMEGEIYRVMTEKLRIVESKAVLHAIIAAATTFNLTDFDTSVKDADIVDAIVAATTQSVLSGFDPTSIAMHPVDIAKFQLIKSTNIPRFITTADGMYVNGLKICKTTQITKGTFVLGDFRKYRVRRYKNKVVMGHDGDDFSQNKRTIIAESRLIKYVSTNEKTSFIKGTFATIQAAINVES